MARVPKAVREGTQAAIQAIETEVAGWMPQSRGEKLTSYVKWLEGGVEKSVVCHDQREAERRAMALLARPEVEEVVLVLHIKKVK